MSASIKKKKKPSLETMIINILRHVKSYLLKAANF